MAKPHACQSDDWIDEYYGLRCRVCGVFVPHGCEPWLPDDDEIDDMVREALWGVHDDVND